MKQKYILVQYIMIIKIITYISRDLQNSLIDYERYKEEFDDLTDLVKQLKGKIQKSNDEIVATRYWLPAMIS